jgi:uncharacterized protein YhaN
MSALHFRRLRVRRMPGVETPFTLEDLAPGVNLVHGPNGCGKSTSARAIEAVLWPRHAGAEAASLAAEFAVAEEAWSVSVDGTRVDQRRDAAPATPPLPPADERDRYFLALHDLVHGDNLAFAEVIRRESVGGFDLEAAAKAIEPRAAPRTRVGEAGELDAAASAVRAAEARQAAIRDEENSLADLEARLRSAVAAGSRLEVVGTAIEHARAREAEAEARIRLEPFPAVMERLRGDEAAALAEISERRTALAAELRREEEALAAARRAMADAGLPEGGLGGAFLPALRADLEILREAERGVSELERERKGAERRCIEERDRVGGVTDEARLGVLDLGGIGELADFARRTSELALERRGLEFRRDLLGDGGDEEDPDPLREGARILRGWLREPAAPEADRRSRTLGIVSAGTLLIAGLALAALHPYALAVAAAGLVLLLLVLFHRPVAPSARPAQEAEYRKLGLDLPGSWTPEAVDTLLASLVERNSAAVRRRDRLREAGEMDARIRSLDREAEPLRQQQGDLAERLGLEPSLDAGVFFWTASRLVAWQQALSELAGVDGRIERARDEVRERRAALTERLAAFTDARLETTGDIAGAVADLDDRQRRHAGAVSDAAHAAEAVSRFRGEIEECSARSLEVYRALEVDPGDEAAAASLCDRAAAYREAAAALRECVVAVRLTGERLAAAGAEAALFDAPAPELELETGTLRDRAEEAEDFRRRMVEIRQRVKQARESHDLETALERRDRARVALERARETDVRGIVAHALVEHVRRASRDEHLPEVFRRAQALFARITHGRYELRFSDEETPGFTAVDRVEGYHLSLDQLSSGTRVQLLLAVRVAFVETMERGIRLPLVLDEVLGNSDDERARAIMEAAIELVKDGRQLFYFTAQFDEVQKWRGILGGHPEVSFREIDLARERNLERRIALPPPIRTFPAAERFPAPEGEDHHEYGRRIGIPSLDPAAAHAGGVHLWYLVDRPEPLHRLLRLGLEWWGQVEGFLASGGDRLLEDGLVSRLTRRARVAEEYLRLARVGRGLPVDRAALEESDAVTGGFLDRVDELAEELGRDPGALLRTLEEGHLARFRQSSIERLAAFLEERGYLDPREPLFPQEIRTGVLAAFASRLADGALTIEEVDGLIERLRLGLGEAAAAHRRAHAGGDTP